MKKIYMLIGTVLFAGAGFAQQNSEFEKIENYDQTKTLERFSVVSNFSPKSSNDKAITSNWFDYTDAYSSLLGTTPSGSRNYLYPDSNITASFGGGATASFGTPFVHGISQTFQVEATAFTTQGVGLDATQSFTIDSIAANGEYLRSDNSVVDTLLFKVIRSSNLVAASVGSQNFITTQYDTTGLSIIGNTEYRILLDSAFHADSTTSGYHYIQLAAGDVIAPATGDFAGVFAISMEFLPGSASHSMSTDTIGVNANAWSFYADELAGDETEPTYFEGDFNVGSIVASSIRYNTDTLNWNGTLIPHWAYTAPYSFESMNIYAKLTGEGSLVGLNEVNNNVKFNVFPNPSNGIFNINLSSNEVNNAILTVKNVVGQTVLTETVNVSGNTNHQISLVDYSKGIYFLTVNNETVKLIVE